MYASLRGASSAEDSAKLDRSSTWNWLARAATNSSQSHSGRSFSVPTELPTPFTDAFHAKELVPQPLRPRSESTKTYDSKRPAKAPIGFRGKQTSVGDLVGKFESKNSETDSAPTPVPQVANTPSFHLRGVYRSTLPSASSPTQCLPPRKRLISSETIQEEGGPFTLKQVWAATTFTTPRATSAQTTISELPEVPIVETSLRKDAGVQTSFGYYDQVARAGLESHSQRVQAEHSYQQASVQAYAAGKDQATQIAVEYQDRDTQFITYYVDQGAQSISANTHLQLGVTEPHLESSEAKAKRSLHDQASQTDHDPSTIERPSILKKNHLPARTIHTVDSEGQLRHLLDPGYARINENPESHSSTDVAFFTARNRSTIAQTRRNGLLDFGVSLDLNTITIKFTEASKVHMLQRIRGGKIVIDPGILPRAQSSEALAHGEVYTSGCVHDEEPKPAARASQSESSPSCSSPSSTSSLDQRPTSPLKVAATEASDTAEGSPYLEGKQQLIAQTRGSVDESGNQQKAPTDTKATEPEDEVAISVTFVSELSRAANSSAQAARRTRVNGKRKSSSVSYWFESEDENPKQVEPDSRIRPQTLDQFRSVPLIRLQRPSTDSEMIFGLGTRAVTPRPSASPVAPTADAPAVPTDNVVLPPASLPTTLTSDKKHFRSYSRDQRSKQAHPSDPAAGRKVGRRDRFKRKGRKKFIYRKRVLRFLLGKDLAERVSQDLHTAGNKTRGATGAAQLANDTCGTRPTSATPRTRLLEPAKSLGVTPLAPAKVDGSDCRSTVSGAPSSDTSVDANTTPIILTLDGSDERKAKHRAKKEIKLQKKEEMRKEEYEQAKLNLEALTSTPCIKCGGQRAYILNFVWEIMNIMIYHDEPDLKRRHRRKEVTKYVESIECRCPRGTSTAEYGSPEAVPKAKELFRHLKAHDTGQHVSRSLSYYGGGGDGGALSTFAATSHFGGHAGGGHYGGHADSGGFGGRCDGGGGGGGGRSCDGSGAGGGCF